MSSFLKVEVSYELFKKLPMSSPKSVPTGGRWEAAGKLLGGHWEAAGRLQGGRWEAVGRLLGGR